ncbi:hypothetical protein ACFX11_025671 [Malus domestica]
MDECRCSVELDLETWATYWKRRYRVSPTQDVVSWKPIDTCSITVILSWRDASLTGFHKEGIVAPVVGSDQPHSYGLPGLTIPANCHYFFQRHFAGRWNHSWIKNLPTKDKDYDQDVLRVVSEWE